MKVRSPLTRARRFWRSHVIKRKLYEMLDDASMHPQGLLLHRFLIGLVVASVLSVVLESVPALAERFGLAFVLVELFAIVIFTIEYLVRMWVATEHPPFRKLPAWQARLKHALTPGALVDLLVILPFYLSVMFSADLRVFVLIRLLRFFKLARYSPGARSIVEAISREKRALGACAMIVCGLVLLAATLMHLAEGHAQPEKLGTIPDAMYWAIVTLGTVGYGDVVPITPMGKFIASITALIGLFTLAMPVGIIATAFAEAIQRREFVVTWSMVARVPIFTDLGAADIAEIMRYLHSHNAETDELVFQKGDMAHAMFFIASGEVEVLLEEPVRLGEGHFFGEMAVLKNTRRQATVRALKPTRLLMLEASDLRSLMMRNPDIKRAIAAALKQRHPGAFSRGDLTEEELTGKPAATRAAKPAPRPKRPSDTQARGKAKRRETDSTR